MHNSVLPPDLGAYPNNWYTVWYEHSNTIKHMRARTPNNKTITGFHISDELWAVLQPLIPKHMNTHRFGGGRSRVPDHRCADAILYMLRTGCKWEALNQTNVWVMSMAHDRFLEWVGADGFLKLLVRRSRTV